METARRSTRISTRISNQLHENIENISHVMNTRSSSRKRSAVADKSVTLTETNKTEEPQIDEQKHSPPKQRKPTTTKATPSSPSTLLRKLSLTTSSPETKPVKSKYENASIVLSSTLTCNLPGRETELEKLSEFLENSFSNQNSSSIYISGPPGTGKTSCVTKLLNESFADKFRSIYINCNVATIASIYKKICVELKLKCGTEKENIKNIVDFITTKNSKKKVLLHLDEIDLLVGNKQSVLYTIFEWPGLKDSKIVIVGIANSLDLTDRFLTRLYTHCKLKPQHLHFVTYTKQQIIDILKSRLEEADVMDIFTPASIQLLAAKVSALSGDIRVAFDVGRRVVEIASTKKKGEHMDLTELGVGYLDEPDEKIKLQDVVSVFNNVYGSTSKTFDDDEDSKFPLQQKITVCAFLMILKNDKNKDITLGRSHTVYSKICMKRNIVPLDQSEFTAMCTSIQDRGIIRVIKNKEPKMRKIQLQCDESEVMTALEDQQLIASILSDTSCLAKKI